MKIPPGANVVASASCCRRRKASFLLAAGLFLGFFASTMVSVAKAMAAQSPTIPTQSCFFDTTQASDSVSVTYSLMQEIVSSHDSIDQMAYSFYAQTIGEHFSPPKRLTLAWLPTGLSIDTTLSPTMYDFGLGGDLEF